MVDELVRNDFPLLPMAADDYTDLKLSDAARQRLAKTLISASAGLVSFTPLVCTGPGGCPFINRCPIFLEDGQAGSYPLKKQCIVEMNLARDKFFSYVEEFNLSGKVEESPTLRSQISKLVDFDLYEYRVKLVLAGVTDNSDGSLLLEQTIAMSKEGDEIIQLQEHPAWKILERIQKQRMELLDALGATIKRQAWISATLKKKDDESVLAKQRKLLERIDTLVEAIEGE